MLQKHFKAATGNKNLVRMRAQVEKKTKFGKSVEAMLDFLKNTDAFDEMEEDDRVKYCYVAYQSWNGEIIDVEHKIERHQRYDYDKDKYFQEMKSTVTTTADTYTWKDFHNTNLVQFLTENPSSTIKDYHGWVKFGQKDLDTSGELLYSIRITIMLEGKSAVERSQLLWKLLKEVVEHKMSTRKVHFGKVKDPKNPATESMILSWLPDRRGVPDNFVEAKRRILDNRQTYSEICQYLKTHYVGELRDPKKLLPFQYREEGCPASISTYFGGHSFGDKLCKAIASKGDIEENTAIYANNGGAMEEFWTFADWMVKEVKDDDSVAQALANGVLNGLTGHA
mmetsp:Transcript_2488/g.4590  ORF Transcript_2488/g.4590 Transcript_2488/m.4590 type:complete len:338 (+) Transcript_2488:618-1631(+)